MGRKYIFTDKRETRKGIMSTVFGLLSLFSVVYSVYQTFLNQGEALVKYGVAVLLSLIFALVGIVLGILSRMEQDQFYVFSWIGIVLNALTILAVAFLVYAGAF